MSAKTGLIFVSYRRTDAPAHAGRLTDRLIDHFGQGSVYMDVGSTPVGSDYAVVIKQQLNSCDVLIAVIGPNWLDADLDGEPRLARPDDWVRLEILNALDRDIRVIPVLVGGASMPAATDLPAELRPLARRQAVELSERLWRVQVAQLVHDLQVALRLSRVVIDVDDDAHRHGGAGEDSDAWLDGDDEARESPPTLLDVPPERPTIAVSARLVTNRRFREFIASVPEWQPANVSANDVSEAYEREWSSTHLVSPGAPAVCVSARAAQAYAAWESDQCARALRLPRADEWQTAAAAGRADGWLAEDLEAGRIACDDTTTERTPVGSFDANPWGIYDLVGNVFDLCVDGDRVVARGGAWHTPCDETLIEHPLQLTERTCRSDVGFRVVCDLGGEQHD